MNTKVRTITEETDFLSSTDFEEIQCSTCADIDAVTLFN